MPTEASAASSLPNLKAGLKNTKQYRRLLVMKNLIARCDYLCNNSKLAGDDAMMYYNCELCKRAIKKPYPSKKYCSEGCRENSRKLRVEEQETQFWNSIKPLAVTSDDQQVLDQMDPAPRAGLMIERMAPPGAVGYRVACRRIGSEAYTVHWFPTARQRPSSLFKLNPVELPLEIPCPTEYVVVYFDAGGRPFATPCFKLFLRGRVISVNWSDGDRRLLIGRSSA